MNTIRTAAAAVLGARHARIARNGQDAVASWTAGEVELRGNGVVGATRDAAFAGVDAAFVGATRAAALAGATRAAAFAGARHADARRDCAAVIVVCDGCSSGTSSEVGARLGTSLFARAMGHRIHTGASILERDTWEAARRDVVESLADLLERMHGDRLDAIRDTFLFTIVAAAMTLDGAAVWALGDGVYSFGDATRELGPFADNEPPYLAYDLLGDAHGAHFATASTDTIIIGTDGATELTGGIERFATSRFLDHPDALRRELAVLARPHERIDWDERRIIRAPAALQDDCAIGVLRREAP